MEATLRTRDENSVVKAEGISRGMEHRPATFFVNDVERSLVPRITKSDSHKPILALIIDCERHCVALRVK